ncbi:MAG: hypothetical protein AVDCRST_MAG78-3250, partial [uncultured Rubrobacteraceae bacterium]
CKGRKGCWPKPDPCSGSRPRCRLRSSCGVCSLRAASLRGQRR